MWTIQYPAIIMKLELTWAFTFGSKSVSMNYFVPIVTCGNIKQNFVVNTSMYYLIEDIWLCFMLCHKNLFISSTMSMPE
jgi:hypothetical protein